MLAALRAPYAEYQRPDSIKVLARVTRRRTQAVVADVQDVVGEDSVQRLGQQDKRGVVPLLGEAGEHR